MTSRLEGQVALVAGASGGIGRAIADAVAPPASPDSGWVTGRYVESGGGLGPFMPGFGGRSS